VSFAAITLCVASQRVIPKVSVYFVIESVLKLLDTLSYMRPTPNFQFHLIFTFTKLKSIAELWADVSKDQKGIKLGGGGGVKRARMGDSHVCVLGR
jgi:hypothetical protein